MTLAETIREATRNHLRGGGLLLSQNVRAVGWIGGTVPEMTEEEGIVELPTSDISNAGVVVGAALAGRKPIYVIRYQGFGMYNSAPIISYSAKSRAWGVKCPIFIRSLAMEGGIGPCTSNAHHGLFMRVPGIAVVAPCTPQEWLACWNSFLVSDDRTFYVSEHRKTFPVVEEGLGSFYDGGTYRVLLAPIGGARLEVERAIFCLHTELISVRSDPILWLSPFSCTTLSALASKADFTVIIDSDYEMVAESLAYKLTHASGKPVYALSLENRPGGFGPTRDNVTPSVDRIVSFVESKL